MPDPNSIEQLLTELPIHPAPPGWEDRVRAAIAANTPVVELRPSPSRWPWWLASGSVGLAAAAAIVLYLGRQSPSELVAEARPTVAIRIDTSSRPARGGSARIGDTIVFVAERADELRVYRDGVLLARCPEDPGCKREPNRLELTLTVTQHGSLAPIAFRPALSRDSAGPSGLDTDIGLAARTGVQMSASATIDVP